MLLRMNGHTGRAGRLCKRGQVANVAIGVNASLFMSLTFSIVATDAS